MKDFLINLIDEERDDPFVQSSPKDWGDQIGQRAIPWAKRLYLLYRVKCLIKMYKVERKAYMERTDTDPAVLKEFTNWDNLLNFLPSSVFYGQRPSIWWTLRHDIDLLYGTYKYGYATYNSMRCDTNLSFYKTELVQG